MSWGSRKTIKNLVSPLLAKLGVHSRTGAALLAIRAGIHGPGHARGAGSPAAQRLQAAFAARLGLDHATAAQFRMLGHLLQPLPRVPLLRDPDTTHELGFADIQGSDAGDNLFLIPGFGQHRLSHLLTKSTDLTA